jgi:glycosyltransferase involved in cell wall biosynthesis
VHYLILNPLNCVSFAIQILTLDILIPIYNPHEQWADEVVRQYNKLVVLLPKEVSHNLIMVNDGSQRNLESDAKKILDQIEGAIWITYDENMGKGYALRQAVKASSAELMMFTDYDFPYTYGSMVRMIEKLMNPSTDAVVGNRDESYYQHISSRRKRISQFLRKVNKLIFRLPTDDTQCGLKAFKANKRELFLSTKTNRYLIDVEFLKKLGDTHSHVDIQLVKLREGVVLSKISNLSLFKEMINYLKIMLS